jgi:hypothetical protein
VKIPASAAPDGEACFAAVPITGMCADPQLLDGASTYRAAAGAGISIEWISDCAAALRRVAGGSRQSVAGLASLRPLLRDQWLRSTLPGRNCQVRVINS